MNELTLVPPPEAPERCGPDTAAFPARARWLLKMLDHARDGRLAIAFPDGQRGLYGSGGPQAEITLANWNVIDATLERGDIGCAEAYVAGDWAAADPVAVLRFFIRNRTAVDRLIYGSFLGRLMYRLRHLARRNSRGNARRNIQAHYDLGNEFYAIWLDPSMTYSSALFDAPGESGAAPTSVAASAELQRGQAAKYRRALDQLQLPKAAKILEIGCGWGGLAEIAARAGHRVTGLTLSPAQLLYARQRLDAQGLDHDLALRDYRDATGQYDGIVSIEMFEAVGEPYWPRFFEVVARCLKPGARACIQTITIDGTLFERYRSGTDFIQQYVFPGGMLPSVAAFEAAAGRAGLRVVARHGFGASYARTLAAWRARFGDRLAAVRALGFDERFMRTWNFYLAYCEAAFAEGSTDVFQFTLARA